MENLKFATQKHPSLLWRYVYPGWGRDYLKTSVLTFPLRCHIPNLFLCGSFAGADSCIMLFRLHLKQDKRWSTPFLDTVITSVSQCQWDVFAVCRRPFPSGSIPGSRRPPSGAFQNKRPGGPCSQIPARSRHELDHNTGDTRMSSLAGKKKKKKGPNRSENRVNLWCSLFCEINVFSENLYNQSWINTFYSHK